MDNNGLEYELFVKNIYERLLKIEKNNTITIQHNIKINGSSGVKHQIDLYWEIVNAGIQQKVIFECKDYSNKVTKEKIMAFHSVLEDIGGAVGVYVTRIGYQKGAKEMAKKYNIKLYEIRKPNKDDWGNRIREIHIEYDFIIPNIKGISTKINNEWASMQNPDIINKIIGKKCIFAPNTLIVYKDEGKTEILSDFLQKVNTDKIGTNLIQEFKFTNTYLKNENGDIKIDSIIVKYDVHKIIQNQCINGEEDIDAIIKDVFLDSGKFLNKNDEIIELD